MAISYGPGIPVLGKGFQANNAQATYVSLNEAQMIRPDFSDMLISLYPVYSLQYMMASFALQAPQYVTDASKKFFVQGRFDNPLTVVSVSGNGQHGSSATITLEEGYGEPTAFIYFDDLQQVIQLQGYGVSAPGGYKYPYKLITTDPTETFAPTAGTRGGMTSGVAEEGSPQGYGTMVYPDLIENFTSTYRMRREFTRSSASTSTWLNMGSLAVDLGLDAMQFLTAFGGNSREIKDGGFLYRLEKALWTQKNTVAADGSSFITLNGKPLMSGAGIFDQIPNVQTANFDATTFSPNFMIDQIQALKFNAGAPDGIDIYAHCGAGFSALFQKSLSASPNIRYESTIDDPNRTMTYGQEVYTILTNGCRLHLLENPILSDPTLFPTPSALGPWPKHSYDCYLILDHRSIGNGQPTIQKYVRQENGVDSNLIIKQINGMIGDNSKMTSSSFDGLAVEFLSEFVTMIEYTNCIQKLKYTGN